MAQATRLGFAFAEQAQLTSFGPLSSPLISAGSVAEIVDLLTYLPLISTALKSQFHTGDYGLIVGLTAHTGDSALDRSEEHTSELQSLMRISYAVFCLKKKHPNNKPQK